MRVIWKYPIQIINTQKIRMPKGAEVLSVGIDPDNQPCVWCSVDPYQSEEYRTIHVVDTGEGVPDNTVFVGTFIYHSYVGHIFIEK